MKYIYSFKEGNKDLKDILGGKGANLAEMTSIGLPVPSGFVVSTDACRNYLENGEIIEEALKKEIFDYVNLLEEITGKNFSSKTNPLLVSVRSGAAVSMPGMMDTILNLGMNDEALEGLISKTSKPMFAFDSYRRFIEMYGNVVEGIEMNKFLSLYKENFDNTEESLRKIIELYKELFKAETKKDFPTDPKEQLINSIEAVFKSWNNERAKAYRRINGIADDLGTAVNIQEMVFGNMDDNSCSGVLFSRDPATGENKQYGEYIVNAQGEDIVSGIKTPKPIEEFEKDFPENFKDLEKHLKFLEKHYKDMQDIEFTVESNKLYILQTRSGKRTAKAALKIALDLSMEEIINKEEAILMVEPESLSQLLHSKLNTEGHEPIGKGLAASPGAVSGKIAFSTPNVLKFKKEGIEDIILVRPETLSDDIEGAHNAGGLLTIHGGMTSHAAVVARGMGIPCVTGAKDLVLTSDGLKFPNGEILKELDEISLDGDTGLIYKGKLEITPAEMNEEYHQFMEWVDEKRVLEIKANADIGEDVKKALKNGATGIGLCRTEHMFFEKERLLSFRKMLLAPDENIKKRALDEVLNIQRSDFEEIFKELDNKKITIRLIDPPLHEFFPKLEEEIKELATNLNIDFQELEEILANQKEQNPMLGHRGCRLGVSHPEIVRMQTRAIIEAALNLKKENINPKLEIMIPLVSMEKEYIYIKDIVEDEANIVFKEKGDKIYFEVGLMIETPRATIISDKLSRQADFFSFGTNDLTQMTYGFSRDDASFLEYYYKDGLMKEDPFKTIDQEGIGVLMYNSIVKGRREKSSLVVGICGEHGGDPKSIEFAHKIGINYVSCSPFRVPIARLAAAQAVIKNKK